VLGGFIDFYFAGVDQFVFDLAVTANDWCIDRSEADTGVLDSANVNALLTGYNSVRKLSEAEQTAWPMALRAAAYRFWVSRLYDWHLPRAAAMLTPKDPSHFERLLMARREGH
jgi:homoserine kinase type II